LFLFLKAIPAILLKRKNIGLLRV